MDLEEQPIGFLLFKYKKPQEQVQANASTQIVRTKNAPAYSPPTDRDNRKPILLYFAEGFISAR